MTTNLKQSRMAYPGEGNRMAVYGTREHDPQQTCNQWKEYNKKLNHFDKTHIALVGEESGVWKGVKPISDEEKIKAKSYFANPKSANSDSSTSSYDSVFTIDVSYNSKLHRDDRQHNVGLDINTEELGRIIPVRSSSEYGRRVHQPLELPTRAHVRIDKVNKGFMRANGVGIPKGSDINNVQILDN